MPEKGQIMRFTKSEIDLMKSVFLNNDELLYLIRRVFLQKEITEEERKSLKTSMTDTVVALMHKSFLPTVDADAPLFQLTDMHMGLQTDMKTLGVDAMIPLMKAKELEIKYLTQQLEILKGKDVYPSITLQGLTLEVPNQESWYVNITARNYLLSHIDSVINQFKFLAFKEIDETPEKAMERMKRDSNK